MLLCSAVELPAPVTNRIAQSWNLYRVYRRITSGRRNVNRFSGVFSTFDEARAAVPAGRQVGYDTTELASWYRERLDTVYVEDYPVLFWMQRLLPGLKRVFDFGGHIGLHFYAWNKVMNWPATLRWTVSEVPAVVDEGRAFAKERGATQLDFTARPQDCDGADLFLASGSLQYLEPGFLPSLLGEVKQRPKHVLLSKLPVHANRDYVTLQDAHLTFHPYTIVSRARLVDAMSALGYQLKDEWQSHEHDCRVMLQPALDVPAYTGALFSAE